MSPSQLWGTGTSSFIEYSEKNRNVSQYTFNMSRLCASIILKVLEGTVGR